MILNHKILQLLNDSGVPYQLIEHPEAHTCTLAAQLRERKLEAGLKTVLFKDKRKFVLFALRADRQVDSKKVRKILGSQKLRFATEDELIELTGAKKGSLPPFGKELFSELELYLDESVHDAAEVAFNIGILT
jgi:Ala-tRNA(Pro) deacylase